MGAVGRPYLQRRQLIGDLAVHAARRKTAGLEVISCSGDRRTRVAARRYLGGAMRAAAIAPRLARVMQVRSGYGCAAS